VLDFSSLTSGITITESDPAPVAFAAGEFTSMTEISIELGNAQRYSASQPTVFPTAIRGTETNDTYFGNSADNIVNGGGGNDMLNGGAGNDNLAGGAGADFIAGGLGSDTLTGGAGADKFRYFEGDLNPADADLITDLEENDRIDLSAIGGITVENIEFNEGLLTITTPTGKGYIYLSDSSSLSEESFIL
jgi:Ca2+-binding RTX toxin-like protein